MSRAEADALLDALADLLAARVADRVAERLEVKQAPARVRVADVPRLHGVSQRWLRDRAREGKIEVAGPRGAQSVDAAELARLLVSTHIKKGVRARRAEHEQAPEDPKAVVAELARKRRTA
jgi:hypothetical protein